MDTIYRGNAKTNLTKSANVRKAYPNGQIIGAIKPGQHFTADSLKADSQLRKWLHVIEVDGHTPTYLGGWAAEDLFTYETIPPVDTPPIDPEPETGDLIFTMHDTKTGENWYGVLKKMPNTDP